MQPIYTFISHDDFVADVRALATALAASPEWQPTLIVGIGRGGLVPAVYLSHATGIPMASYDLSGQTPQPGDNLLARLAARTRAGDRLLFVDDINDTGRTIGLLRRWLDEAGAREGSVRFATLLDNQVSDQKVAYRARSIDRRVVKDWFVFPWEAVASAASIAEDAAEVPERTG
ncbi:phosphoribosyltransferase family protein [Sphingomonas sp.]|uniref:phosphoribosyltransferase n=1 Tax=Sphingomonas sp. TaxID=28214 RepID=UPI00260AC564|nr:phosphoribosyltransferase family protein [Sphingomonas sp.]MDF2494532.1 phosphoribosyltransferase [Sphingomonas sp.]